MSTAEIMSKPSLPAAVPVTGPFVQIRAPMRQEWVPSQFNARTTTDDGRLVLWNTYSGALSVFQARAKPVVVSLLSRQGFTGEPRGLTRYLIKRGFIVPRRVDELRRIRADVGREHYRTDILELILLASEDCNFRCTYCYEDFKRGTMGPNVREGIKSLLRNRGRTLRMFTVAWFGGEPLYGWDAIADLAPFFQEYCRQHDIAFGSNMTTNGYLLTGEVQEKLLAWGVRKYQITLDGLAEDHDQRRCGRDGSPTFETILVNLRELHRRTDAYQVLLRINFDRENNGRLDALLQRLCDELELDTRFELHFHPVGRWGGPNDDALNVCGKDDGPATYWRLIDAAMGRGLNVGRGVEEYRGPIHGTGVCYAARPYNFIVGADGKLMKCTIALDKEDVNVVGHLTADGELVLDEDKLALWTEPAFEDDKVCRHCHVLPVCQGMSCPLARIDSGKRSCHAAKLGLRRELLTTVALAEARARAVTVQTGDEQR